MNTTRAVRRSIALVVLGLLFQLFASLYWTPATFILFACIGVPLVLGGAGYFLWTVWRILRQKGAV